MTASLTGVERRVADAVDVEGLVDAVRRLVRIPSWNGDEVAAQEFMAQEMGETGLQVDAWEIDLAGLAVHRAYSAEIERERALGVVGTLPGRGDGRSLILNGHVDVVPPGDASLWSHSPFGGDLVEGRIHGRGALDMKGPLLAALFALRAIRTADVELAGTVHLQSVVGEEDGGMGTLAAILRGYRADGAVVMEPTQMAVAPALSGVANFRIRVPGLAAHGAVRDEGVSALEKLFGVYAALQALETERNARLSGESLFEECPLPFAISVGTVRGGDWPSSVPDHVTVEGRMGIAPGEDRGDARRALQEAVAAAASDDPWLREHPPEVSWWGGRFFAARIPVDHPVVRAIHGAASAIAGRPLPIRAMTYGADLGLLASEGGTPGVLFGPGDIRRAHRPDEWVAVDELVAAARALAVGTMRFCGSY